MPEITRIEKTFTYDIADAYLHQTNALNRTAEWTYTGPDKLYMFIDATTLRPTSRYHLTDRDNGAEVPTPEGMIKVMVNANTHPEIASLLHEEKIYGELPHTVENLPDNTTYGHPDPIPPDHTYELTELEYDLEAQEFKKPYPWKKPHMTWEELILVRNADLKSSDTKLLMAQEEDKAAWETYRQKLRDLPTTFAGVDPWKVTFPQSPEVVPTPGV